MATQNSPLPTGGFRQITRSWVAFRHRDFRLIWASTALTSMSQQMDCVVAGWYVLQITNSPTLVGAIVSARLAMTILAAFSGTVADRIPRRLVLITTQALLTVNAAVLLRLVATDHL